MLGFLTVRLSKWCQDWTLCLMIYTHNKLISNQSINQFILKKKDQQ